MTDDTTGPALSVVARLRGLGVLIGFFCAVCSVFSLIVAAADAWVDRLHESWPKTVAVVRSTEFETVKVTGRGGGGTMDELKISIEFAAAGRAVATSIRTAPAYRGRWTVPMDAWQERHPPASRILIRYDPKNLRDAELVDQEGIIFKRHWREDLILAAVFGAAAVVLIALRPRPQKSL